MSDEKYSSEYSDWPSGTPEWDERDDAEEAEGEESFVETLCEALVVSIAEPGVACSTVISFWVMPPRPFYDDHPDFGPIEI